MALQDFLKSIHITFSEDKKIFESLKNILGFYPSNIALYKQAFRHSSVAQEIKEGVRDSNERLEFLGDAILSGVIAHYLFTMFPYKDEGFLTKTRSKLVSRHQLNILAQKMGINTMIDKNLNPSAKDSSINGDAFEALIGAVYLDKGYNTARDYILNRILKIHIDINEIETRETDFKSRIMEWVQKEKKGIKYQVNETLAPNHRDKIYNVELVIDNDVKGKGSHFSKKRAEQIASEEACMGLGIL